MASDQTLAGTKPWPAYAAFCDYFATGEGRTVIVAIGATAEEARLLFEENAPAFFAPSMQIEELTQAYVRDSGAVTRWIPAGVIERIASSVGPLRFYGMFHQNVS